MATLKELREAGKVGKGDHTYTGQELVALAKAGTVFTVTGGQYGSDDNGEYNLIEAQMEKTGVKFKMRFRSHPERDVTHMDLLQLAVEEPITHCRLRQINDNDEYPLIAIDAA